MFINVRGIRALQQLRIEHQESAGLDFPDACLTEMLFLHDVCKYLELNVFQAREVLGAQAWEMVNNYINQPAVYPTDKARQLLSAIPL